MGSKTEIEWTRGDDGSPGATWNPIRARRGSVRMGTAKIGWACTKVSPGCTHCYAERLNRVRGTGADYSVSALKDVELFLDETILTQPLRWKRPRRIFACSMTDLFEERVLNEWIDKVFAVMALATQHTFQVLTKRAERMQSYCAALGKSFVRLKASCPTGWTMEYEGIPLVAWPLPNLWLGVSVENQARADERIPWLLKTPAAVRFLSVEPLLGPVDLSEWVCSGADGQPMEKSGPPISWVIAGGESGGPPERALVTRESWHGQGVTKHGPWEPTSEALEWVRSLRDQCASAGVPFFFKQWGGVRKKKTGRELEGRTWDEMPQQGQLTRYFSNDWSSLL